jgi:hypothetical protein
MMGGFQFSRVQRRVGARALAGRPLPAYRLMAAFLVGATVLAIAALLGLASPAGAEPPDRAPTLGSETPPKPRVSTSPETMPEAPNRMASELDRPRRVVDDGPPLTRAATRERLARMSPTHWLAHFGDVSIERHD